MATKTLTITEDAYERLAAEKEKNESFSDVIVRKFGRHSLLELAGILSNKEAAEMKKHIKERREAMRKRMDETAKRMGA